MLQMYRFVRLEKQTHPSRDVAYTIFVVHRSMFQTASTQSS